MANSSKSKWFLARLSVLFDCFWAFVFVAALAFGVLWGFVRFAPVVVRDVDFEIANGDGAVRFCRKVKRSGAFSHKRLLCLYSRVDAVLTRVAYFPHSYKLKKGMTTYDVVRKIRDVDMHRITIPEGLTVHEVAQILQADSCVKGNFPEGVVEGSLMPDTYMFFCGVSASEVVSVMRKAMTDFLSSAWINRDQKIDRFIVDPYSAIVAASVVEKEAAHPDERPLVSSVMLNRLSKRMRLEMCTTLIYALTGGKGHSAFGKLLSNDDLFFRSPYNTYRNWGLPPSAISNPGRGAILAVLHPADTEYLFFVADGKGRHLFSSVFNDHVNRKNRTRSVRLRQYKSQLN